MDITIILIILNLLGIFTFSWWHLLWMFPAGFIIDGIIFVISNCTSYDDSNYKKTDIHFESF